MALPPLSPYVRITDPEGRPTPEFFQWWQQQIRVNSTIPDLSTPELVTPVLDVFGTARGSLLYRSTALWTTLAPGTAGQVLKSGGEGADPAWGDLNFLALTDTPVAYSGQAGKAVKVNAGASGLEFVDILSTFLSLTDAPSTYLGQAGKVPVVNGDEDGLEFGDLDFLALTDTPADYSGAADKLVKVTTGEDGLEFYTPEFTDLADTPADYSGAADKLVKVSTGEDGLEFYTPEFTDLADTPADYSGAADKAVRVKHDESGLEFVDDTLWTVPFCTVTGTNTKDATSGLNIPALVPGLRIAFIDSAGNTGSTTINLDGLGAKTCKDRTGADLTSGYIRTDVPTEAVYDGTNWIVAPALIPHVSKTDTTAGRLMLVGAGGILGLAPLIGNMSVTDNSIAPGIHTYNATDGGSSGGPSGVGRGAFLHTRRAAGGGETQLFLNEATNRTYSRSRVSGAWTAWATNLVADGTSAGDFESGTWTPVLRFGGASTGMNGTFSGRYQRIGKRVRAEFTIALTAKGSATGTATMVGLPYASAAAAVSVYGLVRAATGMLTASIQGGLGISLNANSSTLNLYRHVTSGSGTAALADTDFTDTSDIRGAIEYEVA